VTVFLAPKLLVQKTRPGHVFPYGAVSGLKQGLAHELPGLHRLPKSRFSGILPAFFLPAEGQPWRKEVKES